MATKKTKPSLAGTLRRIGQQMVDGPLYDSEREDGETLLSAAAALEALLDVAVQLDATADGQLMEHVQNRRLMIKKAIALGQKGGAS